MMRYRTLIVWTASTLALGGLTACHKKTPIALAPPAPQAVTTEAAKPNPPTIREFTVAPGRVERGQSATLRWQVEDATHIEIDSAIGPVSASGQRSVSPGASTTYTLVATGDGGKVQAVAALEVTAPPPPPPPPSTPQVIPQRPTLGERLTAEVPDAYFDFDKYAIRPDAMAVLTKDAEALKAIFSDFPNTTIVIEGHCDERGSAEYNLGLGDRRTSSAKEYLEQLGVPADRLIRISYGKERPQCTESNEDCWQKNRRVHFVPGETQKTSGEGAGPGAIQEQ